MPHTPDPHLPDSATAEAGPRSGDSQFVTFSVADEMFAVPMAPVQEIIRMPEVARLPLAPPALDGLANLRGRVLPIVNLRALFHLQDRPHDEATRVLVINLGQPLGFVVDHVASVVNVAPGEVEPAAQTRSIVQADCLRGVIRRAGAGDGHPLMLVLDFERLVAGQFSGAAHAQGHGDGPVLARDSAAREPTDAPGADGELRLVSFTVAGQEYAIDIADVQEIVQLPGQVTAVPNAPPHVQGLIALRRRLLPLVSLRSLFGLPALGHDEHHRIVVVAVPGGGQVGLVTDAVKEVLSVPRAQADAMPGVLARDERLQEFEALCRLDDGRRLVSVIATARLLGLPVLHEALAAAQAHPTEEDDTMDRHAATRETATDDDLQAVVFRLGAEEFGVPIMSVQEIVRVPEQLTRVPRTPAFVEGVINLRGTVLPVIDQRARLGLPAIERNDRQRIMVYTLAGLRTGFIVDSVAEVLRIGSERIEAAPALAHGQDGLISHVARLDGDRRLVMLIEPGRLLQAQEAGALQAAPGLADATGLAPALPMAA